MNPERVKHLAGAGAWLAANDDEPIKAVSKPVPAKGAVTLTLFPTEGAQSKKQVQLTLPELADVIQNTTRESKAVLPWLKFAKFGNKRTKHNSLRTNNNMISFTGIEADYDEEEISFEQAIDTVRRVKLNALLYTSASYKPDAPHWRVCLPLAKEIVLPSLYGLSGKELHRVEKERSDIRAQLVARINGCFGGTLCGVSFVLSQSFYYGGVGDNPSHRALVVNGGDYIDERPDLDASAIGKRHRKDKQPVDPSNKTDADKLADAGKWAGEGTAGSGSRTDIAGMFADIHSGKNYHESIRDIAMYFAATKLDIGAAKNLLYGALDASEGPHDERWEARRNGDQGVGHLVDTAYEKVAENEEIEAVHATAAPDTLFDPWAEFIVPEFPLDILSPVTQKFVVAQAEVIGCDVSSMTMATLTAYSGALDHSNSLKMMRHGNWYVTPRLWTLLNGDSSQKKTPIINAVTRPIEEYQQKLWNRYKDECLYAEDPETIRKPMRYVVYDTTIEKLADILSYSNRGVLVKRDEIAGWIGSMEKYGGTGRGASAKRAFWLQAYDGGSYIVDRIQRGQTIVNMLSTSLLGGIQPQRLSELQGLTSDGLLQRFLPVMMGASKFASDIVCGVGGTR